MRSEKNIPRLDQTTVKKLPVRDYESRLVIASAPEMTWRASSDFWARVNSRMDEELDRKKAQVVILSQHADLTIPLTKLFTPSLPDTYKTASVKEGEYPDKIPYEWLNDTSPNAESVYIVASAINESDIMRIIKVAGDYRNTYNAKCITLVAPFFPTRGDKNVNDKGEFVPTTVDVRAYLGAMSEYVNRIMIVEPHSCATQYYAAEVGVPLFPLSPWQMMVDRTRNDLGKENIGITKDNALFVGPDRGRNIAAVRAQEYLGIPRIAFQKHRTGPDRVIFEPLSKRDISLIKNRIAFVYDDEFSTGGTIFGIADALQKYGADRMIAMLAHGKFTPGWEDKLRHPLLKAVYLTDSREPIGNIASEATIRPVSLAPLIRDLIVADINGVNFWEEQPWRGMVLQPLNGAEEKE